MTIRTTVLALLGGVSLTIWSPILAAAEWTLDNSASRLNFISVKAGTVAEVHRFRELSGSVASDGRVQLLIDVSSVDTGIEIRDQRMRELLFQASRFPTASLDATVDLAALEDLAPGAVTTLAAEAQLRVLEQVAPVTLELTVARLNADRLLVSSGRPVVVDAGRLGLKDGVEQLREVAGLSSISPAVPVTFQLLFNAER